MEKKGRGSVIVISTPTDRINFWGRLYFQERKEKTMKSRLVPNNVTLAELRKLRETLKKIAGEKEAVHVELSLWHYQSSISKETRIREDIGVYHSEGGTTEHFRTLKEAYKHLEKIKKGEA